MCIQQKDMAAYRLIADKMAAHSELSEKDKQFMVEHGLEARYNGYVTLLDIKQRFYGSTVPSLRKY